METNNNIAIVGTGFAGICTAVKLKEAGIHNFVMLEKSSDIGGTWRDNTYPGAACDVSSHLYSFSFEPNPNWSRMFSPQKEIYDYLWHCVRKYDLEKHIRFGVEVTGGVLNEETGTWKINTKSGEVIEAKIFVNGMGPLNRAAYPEIKGLDSFIGKKFHSSHWDHSFDIANKKLAIIGTGASAVQIVPAIAGNVQQMYLYQRTAPWVIPKQDREMMEWEKKMFRAFPFTQRMLRGLVYWISELVGVGFVVNPNLLKLVERMGLRHIEKEITDPDLRKKVTPHFRLGCKRILPSNEYYATLNKDSVELITNGIDRIEGSQIICKDGSKREVDAIVFSTGFQASEYPTELVTIGREGKSLADIWKNGPEGYLGTTVSGFPNMLTIIGPNTGLGHNSMVYMIEAQVNYILDYVLTIRKNNLKWMDVKPEVQREYNKKIQSKLLHTVWNTGCKSWYLTSTGKNTSIWPDFTFRFRKRTKTVRAGDYELASL